MVRPSDTFLPSLQRLRVEHELSQVELAKRAGVARSSVARIERGERANAITAQKLARALGLTVKQLQTEEPA
ncbi:MAG TPA: helix-turn-helix transcriptional regulator [Ktedonobacterales bacterium]|nr:helix-turn-helix transcriptional regulator [Ktedonobacterales bacterium]